MILGIGIDSIEIARFRQWHRRSLVQLQRIFSPEEIDYCLQMPAKSAERFAARFAAREAFFKALCSAFPEQQVPFLTLCKAVAIHKNSNGTPNLVVDWQLLKINPLKPLISLTHTNVAATALVMLSAE